MLCTVCGELLLARPICHTIDFRLTVRSLNRADSMIIPSASSTPHYRITMVVRERCEEKMTEVKSRNVRTPVRSPRGPKVLAKSESPRWVPSRYGQRSITTFDKLNCAGRQEQGPAGNRGECKMERSERTGMLYAWSYQHKSRNAPERFLTFWFPVHWKNCCHSIA